MTKLSELNRIMRAHKRQVEELEKALEAERKALELACEALADEFYTVPNPCKKKEWQAGAGDNVLVCSHDCDRKKCYREYFREQVKDDQSK